MFTAAFIVYRDLAIDHASMHGISAGRNQEANEIRRGIKHISATATRVFAGRLILNLITQQPAASTVEIWISHFGRCELYEQDGHLNIG